MKTTLFGTYRFDAKLTFQDKSNADNGEITSFFVMLFDDGKKRTYSVTAEGEHCNKFNADGLLPKTPNFTCFIQPWVNGMQDEKFFKELNLNPNWEFAPQPEKEIVFVCVTKFEETIIDRWYNKYCERKGRLFDTDQQTELL